MSNHSLAMSSHSGNNSISTEIKKKENVAKGSSKRQKITKALGKRGVQTLGDLRRNIEKFADLPNDTPLIYVEDGFEEDWRLCSTVPTIRDVRLVVDKHGEVEVEMPDDDEYEGVPEEEIFKCIIIN